MFLPVVQGSDFQGLSKRVEALRREYRKFLLGGWELGFQGLRKITHRGSGF